MDTQLFQTRLTETIAWCSLQVLENNPVETEEFRNRTVLARQGNALYRRAELLEKKGSVQSWLLAHLSLSSNEKPADLRRRGLELMRAGDVTSILPLNHQLRTLDLKPRPFVWPQNDRVEIVGELGHRRADLLRRKRACPSIISGDLSEGQLLLYEPDDNVADGASQHQSFGYFDGNDAPPWDTWVCYSDKRLVSWVPPSLIDIARRGIDVNCVDCIRFVESDSIQELIQSK